jgi:hypothetical protein
MNDFRKYEAPELEKWMNEHCVSEMVFEDETAKMKLNEWIKNLEIKNNA